MSTPKPSPFLQGILVLMIMVGFFANMFLPVFIEGAVIDVGMSEVLKTFAALIVGYYFGTSKSSEDKSQVIANQLPAVNQATTEVEVVNKDPIKTQEVK